VRELADFAEDHPVLEYVIDGPGFNWPTMAVDCAARDIHGGAGAYEWAERGLLGAPGYKVGRRGLDPVRRHHILDRVLACDALTVSGLLSSTALSWGSRLSARRLKRMAYTIAWLVQSRGNRVDADSYQVGIVHWESDLDYLKAKYCGTRWHFDWPSTRVR
jgi:hypothetical protein